MYRVGREKKIMVKEVDAASSKIQRVGFQNKASIIIIFSHTSYFPYQNASEVK